MGPAAHSYIGEERSWNVSSVKKYMEELEKGGVYNEKEILEMKDRFNDYLIISLRAKWGISMGYIRSEFGEIALEALSVSAKQHLESGLLLLHNNKLTIDPDHWLKADMILRDLIME